MQSLKVAIYNRWNAAGLDDSIAELYPAGEGRSATANRSGTPDVTDLPRAQYRVMFPRTQQKSRNSRMTQAVAQLEVFVKGSASTSGDETISGYMDNVHDAYVNSDNGAMTMTGGEILEVDDGGQLVEKIDDDVWMGRQTLIIRVRMNQPVPA